MTETANILPIELRDVSYYSGNKRILKDISLTIDAAPGLTVLLGPNGAGKSLLLRLCHGLIESRAGTVTWNGSGDPGLQRQQQAMVFQRPILLRRSVQANLDFALNLTNMAASARRDRIAEILEMTGLSRYAHRPARQLSFGEQQRLALGRALAMKPRLLLLDEPCANLDPAASYMVESLLQTAVANRTRVVMATHDLGQARRLANDVIFMFRGRVKEHRPADDFFDAPENDLSQAFLRGELLWWRRRSIFSPDDGKPDDDF